MLAARCNNIDDPATALGTELHSTLLECEQRVIATAPDTRTGMEVRTALTNDDLARTDNLTAETLDAEALRVRVTTVASGTRTLLVCHVSLPWPLLNTGDLDAREVLAVPLALLVSGLVLKLLNDDLGAAKLLEHLGRHPNL